MITAIKRFSSKVNTIIDLLLLKVVTVIKKMFGIKPAAGGAAAPGKGKDKGKGKEKGKGKGKKSYKGKGGKKKKGDKGKGKKKKKKGDKGKKGITEKDRRKHVQFANAIKHELEKKPNSSPPMDFKAFWEDRKRKAASLESIYNPKVKKKVAGKWIKVKVTLTPINQDQKDNDVDFKVVIAPNTTTVIGHTDAPPPPENRFKARKLDPNGSKDDFKGRFENFPDWNGYPNPVRTHPANKILGFKGTANVPKPGGEYVVRKGRSSQGAPPAPAAEWRAFIDGKKNKYKESMLKRNPSMSAGQAENAAKANVEREYVGWNGQYHHLWLWDWQGHHIKPVNWKGTDSKRNLQYLHREDHSPFTTWWERRKREIINEL